MQAFVVAGVPLPRDFDFTFVAFCRERSDILEQRFLGRVQVAHEVDDPAFEHERLRLFVARPLILQHDGETAIQERHHLQPLGNSREKNAAMRALGAELVEYGDDFHAADHHADELARERALFRMPSFDLLLVRGVASYALEFFRDAPPLDSVFVPVGWG